MDELKVGQKRKWNVYFSNKQTLEVLCIGNHHVFYRYEDGAESSHNIKSLLEDTTEYKEPEKWYVVTTKRKDERPYVWATLHRSKEEFFKFNTEKESAYEWIDLKELVRGEQ